jgi:uncharacterized membrane protein
MGGPLSAIVVPNLFSCSRRGFLRAAGVGALAITSARNSPSSRAQAGEILPGTPLGLQITWILAQINGGAATVTASDVTQHFAPALLAGLPVPQAIEALKELAKKGPLTFRGFPDLPTATSAIAEVSAPTGKLYRLSVAIEPAAPSRITVLVLAAVPEVTYSPTPLVAPPGAIALDADYKLLLNNAGHVVAVARFPNDVWGTVLWKNGTVVRLVGPNGENVFRPQGIDAAGRVLASWTAPNQSDHGCLWQDGQLVDLGPLPGGQRTQVFGMNSDGVIVGWSTTGTPAEVKAVRWVDGQPEPLSSLPGADSTVAVAINSAGLIAGYAVVGFGTNRALLWDETGVTDLGPLAESQDTGFPGTGPGQWDEMNPNPGPPIIGLNEQGEVAWTGVMDEGVWHPFRWANGVAADLGAFDHGQQTHEPLDGVVTALAGDGVIVGWAKDLLMGEFRPFLWEDEVMTDLGVLPGGRSGSAVAIGGFGRIVGWSDGPAGMHAVIWGEWGLTDLGTLPGDLTSEAVAVNDGGQILGWSYANDAGQTPHPVLWIPNPS